MIFNEALSLLIGFENSEASQVGTGRGQACIACPHIVSSSFTLLQQIPFSLLGLVDPWCAR